ncbi:MAG: DUF2608 domain-containing protein [Puniceicoccales bacterium]|jgi:hypothetical protein|nr:DUF2608 domain-containing protein [Puniceicoccales bacterium]
MKVGIALFWILYYFTVMVTESEGSSAILQLTPRQVAQKLGELIADGTIGEDTLFVWDIDNTLIQAGSDYSPSGVQPICPTFFEIIRMTQSTGIMHIALTNASPFNNDLNFEDGILDLVSIPEVVKRSPYPNYFRKAMDSKGPVTFEDLRIAGLKHMGIDFTNHELQRLPRDLTTIQFHYDIQQDPVGNELSKTICQSGNVLETWFDESDHKEYCHIEEDTIVPGFAPNNRKRHFIQTHDSLSEVVCSPIFSSGIIFCNFINLYTQYYYGHIKGNVLQLFLDECKKQIGRAFSNIVFIDDTLSCVENVCQVMEQIDMPCIGINILTSSGEA